MEQENVLSQVHEENQDVMKQVHQENQEMMKQVHKENQETAQHLHEESQEVSSAMHKEAIRTNYRILIISIVLSAIISVLTVYVFFRDNFQQAIQSEDNAAEQQQEN